jgi:hypothetical protein
MATVAAEIGKTDPKRRKEAVARRRRKDWEWRKEGGMHPWEVRSGSGRKCDTEQCGLPRLIFQGEENIGMKLSLSEKRKHS